MKNKEIKEEYCKEFGYGSFNKYNENDYSKWLEQQLLIQRVSQQRELLERLDKLENWAYNKANEDDLKFLNSIYRSDNCG